MNDTLDLNDLREALVTAEPSAVLCLAVDGKPWPIMVRGSIVPVDQLRAALDIQVLPASPAANLNERPRSIAAYRLDLARRRQSLPIPNFSKIVGAYLSTTGLYVLAEIDPNQGSDWGRVFHILAVGQAPEIPGGARYVETAILPGDTASPPDLAFALYVEPEVAG